MSGTEAIRAQTLSAPNCTFMLGDPVVCRRGPLDHEFHARVVGRTIGRPIYDGETADGELICGLTILRLDEDALRLSRAAGAPGGARRGPTRSTFSSAAGFAPAAGSSA
jgi:hypothetical protein